jgi:hypothetical protein
MLQPMMLTMDKELTHLPQGEGLSLLLIHQQHRRLLLSPPDTVVLLLLLGMEVVVSTIPVKLLRILQDQTDTTMIRHLDQEDTEVLPVIHLLLTTQDLTTIVITTMEEVEVVTRVITTIRLVATAMADAILVAQVDMEMIAAAMTDLRMEAAGAIAMGLPLTRPTKAVATTAATTTTAVVSPFFLFGLWHVV